MKLRRASRTRSASKPVGLCQKATMEPGRLVTTLRVFTYAVLINLVFTMGIKLIGLMWFLIRSLISLTTARERHGHDGLPETCGKH